MARNMRPVGPLNRLIANEVRATRTRKKLTQEELAARAGIPVSTLAKIERFESILDVEQLGRIAAAFDVPLDAFVRAAQNNEVLYRADGTLNPAEVSETRTTDAHLAELAARETEPE